MSSSASSSPPPTDPQPTEVDRTVPPSAGNNHQDLLRSVFDDRAPRHFVEGVTSGMLDVAKGAALGIGCLGAGVYSGIKDGNAASVATGTLGGLAGLVGMTLYGGFRGVKKVFQGCANTPEAIQAAADGDRVWDDEVQTFVRVDVPLLASHLPSTDDDIFDAAKLEMVKEATAVKEEAAKQKGSEGEGSNGQAPTSEKKGPPPTTTMTLYDTLGVPKDAPKAEIRKAYTVKALALHPDKNPDPRAAAEFQRVAEAYRILSNQVSRAQYDLRGDTTQVPNADSPATTMNDVDANPLEEVVAGRAFLPWIGRLRYLLYLHPHMKFSASLIAQYQRRKRTRAAQFLARLLSSKDTPDEVVREATPMIEDMLHTSKIGPQIVWVIGDEYGAIARQFRRDAMSREVDRIATGAMSSVSNAAGIIFSAGKAAVKAYRHTVGEEEMFQLVLAACTGDIQTTAALAARYALIDAAAAPAEKEKRALALEALSMAMTSRAEAQLAAVAAVPVAPAAPSATSTGPSATKQ